MILNNYIKLLYGCFSKDNRTSPIVLIDIAGNKKTLTSTGMPYYFCFSLADIATTQSTTPFCLAVGTDDTPVTAEDYEWSHDISALSNGGYSLTLGNGVRPRVVRTYINNTDSDITIREVALIARQLDAKIMLMREVLTQPLTIKPGGIQAVGLDIGG